MAPVTENAVRDSGASTGPVGDCPTRPEIDVIGVSNYNQRTFELVVGKNHDYSRQLTLMAANPPEELQRYCRSPGHADGPSGRFPVAEAQRRHATTADVEAEVVDAASLLFRERPSLPPRSRVVTVRG